MATASLRSLQVGDKITARTDMFVLGRINSVTLGSWCAGIILEMKLSKIKIKILHLAEELHGDPTEIWIDVKSNRIDRNPTRMQYDVLPNIFSWMRPTSDTISHKNQIIELVTEDGPDPGLYAYNLLDRSVGRIAELPDEFGALDGYCLRYIYMAIDKEKDELYITDLGRVDHESAFCAKYDLLTNEWTSVDAMPLLAIDDREDIHHCVYMPKPIDALYFLSAEGSSGFNWKYAFDQKIVKIENPGFDGCAIHDEPRDRILSLGPPNEICYWDLKEEDEWRKYEIEVPHNRDCWGWTFLGFGSILFVLYLCESKKFEERNEQNGQNEIWCLELNGDRWFKSHKSLPLEIQSTDDFRMVKTDDNYVHCINPGEGRYDRYHIRMSLRDMIPKELLEFYSKLTDGFIGNCLKTDRKKIPMELKQIILMFYCAVN